MMTPVKRSIHYDFLYCARHEPSVLQVEVSKIGTGP